jgi:hypothetical protein
LFFNVWEIISSIVVARVFHCSVSCSNKVLVIFYIFPSFT